MTETYKTRTVSGSSTVGCYYTLAGCAVTTISNTSYVTARTFLNSYFDKMYFYGLNQFIIYHQYSPSDFSTPGNSYRDPTIQMIFTTSTTAMVNTDQYQTSASYTGNNLLMFTLQYGYVIDLIFDCPTSGDIYHVNNYQCNNVCPTGFSINPANNYCIKCTTRCM
jgi:hypothetical protein